MTFEYVLHVSHKIIIYSFWKHYLSVFFVVTNEYSVTPTTARMEPTDPPIVSLFLKKYIDDSIITILLNVFAKAWVTG